MSFSTGGFFFNRCSTLISLYNEGIEWDQISKKIADENLLQQPTQSSLQKIRQEILKRLKNLTDEELIYFENASEVEKKQILWIAVCRTYKFIAEFAIEILREKFIVMDYKLDQDDYRIFFNRKAEWSEQIDNLTASTKNKLGQVMFRILREAEIISEENLINQNLLNEELKSLIKKNNPQEFNFFPGLAI